MADYTIITNDVRQYAKAVKNHTGWNSIQEDFDGPTFKADAIRWLKRVGGQSATFEFVSEAEYHRRG